MSFSAVAVINLYYAVRLVAAILRCCCENDLFEKTGNDTDWRFSVVLGMIYQHDL